MVSPESSNISESAIEYLKDRDYIVETEVVEKQSGYKIRDFFFRTLEWSLIWYARISEEPLDEEPSKGKSVRFFMTSTVSTYKAEKNLTQHMSRLDFLREHWYNWEGYPDFWTTILKEVLIYFKNEYPSRTLFINMVSYDENKPFIINLVNKTKQRTGNLIDQIYWGNQNYTACIRINPEK